MLCYVWMLDISSTEGIADKISSILSFAESLLLHISRGVRWDSDHVAVLNDDVLAIAQEIRGVTPLIRLILHWISLMPA